VSARIRCRRWRYTTASFLLPLPLTNCRLPDLAASLATADAALRIMIVSAVQTGLQAIGLQVSIVAAAAATTSLLSCLLLPPPCSSPSPPLKLSQSLNRLDLH
jgi:hypothetical protein